MSHHLFKEIEARYLDEMETEFEELTKKIHELRDTAVEQHPDIPRGSDGLDNGTISIQDAKLLYLLVRYFKPKVIFEIGTWIGTSAMIMAEAMRKNDNSGHIYTCDANSFYALDDSYQDTITTINAYSDIALTELPADTTIDFVFADGELNFATIKKLKPLLATDAIISTHDFTLPAKKGVLNLVRMQLTSFCKYNYLLPKDVTDKVYSSDSFAMLYSNNIFYKQTLLKKYLLTIGFGYKLLSAKAHHRLFKTYSTYEKN